jgi:hypothetical protein
VFGAAGYAAIALGRDKIDTAAFGDAQDELRRWGWARIAEFRQRVQVLAEVQDAGEDSRIGWWSADKWDRWPFARLRTVSPSAVSGRFEAKSTG